MNDDLWMRAALLMHHRSQARVLRELNQVSSHQPCLPHAVRLAKEALISRGLQPWIPPNVPCLPILIVQGTPPSRLGVAVVGSRASDGYGIGCARRVAQDVVHLGFPVISGGAEGCDASAHEATIESGGETAVVLGAGHDHLYPRCHRALFERVVANNGSIISSYWPDTRPAPHRFLARNKVIALLAKVTVVVRARLRSGALTTARYAQNYGRTVLAVPSDVDEALGQGCNELLGRGAYPMCGLQDLAAMLETPGTGFWPVGFRGRADPWLGNDGCVRPPPQPISDDQRVQIILKVLSEYCHVDLDTLVDNTGLRVETVSSIMLKLEVGGHVRRVGTHRFATVPAGKRQ